MKTAVTTNIQLDEIRLRFNFLFIPFSTKRNIIERTNNEFAILDPIIFPIARDKFPCRTAAVLATHSGADVPNPIYTAQTIDWGILYFCAI